MAYIMTWVNENSHRLKHKLVIQIALNNPASANSVFICDIYSHKRKT